MACKCNENESNSGRESLSANETRKKTRSNSVIPKMSRSKSEINSHSKSHTTNSHSKSHSSNSHSKSHSTNESKKTQRLRRTRSIDEQIEDNETESEVSSTESKSKKKFIRKNSHNSLNNSSHANRRSFTSIFDFISTKLDSLF